VLSLCNGAKAAGLQYDEDAGAAADAAGAASQPQKAVTGELTVRLGQRPGLPDRDRLLLVQDDYFV
jgi:hypothetical protein